MSPLRCRLNDMAFVRPGLPTCEFMRGKVVTIVCGPVADVARQGPGWLVEGHLGVPLAVVLTAKPDLRESLRGDVQRIHLPDSWLLPFRPGAKDEVADKPFELEIVR